MKKQLFILVFILVASAAHSQALKFTDKPAEFYAYLKNNSDTLEIVGGKIKYIKIGDKVYEIVRSVELKEATTDYWYTKTGNLWKVSQGTIPIQLTTDDKIKQ